MRPALLIVFLAASRRVARGSKAQLHAAEFARWRAPHANIAAWIAGGVAMGLGMGLALGQGLLGALLGAAGGAAIGVGVTTLQARGRR